MDGGALDVATECRTHAWCLETSGLRCSGTGDDLEKACPPKTISEGNQTKEKHRLSSEGSKGSNKGSKRRRPAHHDSISDDAKGQTPTHNPTEEPLKSSQSSSDAVECGDKFKRAKKKKKMECQAEDSSRMKKKKSHN